MGQSVDGKTWRALRGSCGRPWRIRNDIERTVLSPRFWPWCILVVLNSGKFNEKGERVCVCERWWVHREWKECKLQLIRLIWDTVTRHPFLFIIVKISIPTRLCLIILLPNLWSPRLIVVSRTSGLTHYKTPVPQRLGLCPKIAMKLLKKRRGFRSGQYQEFNLGGLPYDEILTKESIMKSCNTSQLCPLEWILDTTGYSDRVCTPLNPTFYFSSRGSPIGIVSRYTAAAINAFF